MNERTFYISHDDKQLGPFSQDSILQQIAENKLSPLDHIYDESCQDWVVLLEHPLFSVALSDAKPSVPNQSGNAKSNHPNPAESCPSNHSEQKNVQQNTDSNVIPMNSRAHQDHLVTEWYVLKGENKFGPFAFTDVVKMLQQKVVFEFDFAWHPRMTSWKRIAEIESFNHENIKKLKTTLMPEIEELFFRRRHRRTGFNGTILVHDNKSVWKGQGVEISAGGAGIVMENAMVVPGQVLYLHFKPCDGVPPFNAVCEVVSKQYVDGLKEKTAPIKYGVKFTSISPSAQTVLADYTKKSVAA